MSSQPVPMHLFAGLALRYAYREHSRECNHDYGAVDVLCVQVVFLVMITSGAIRSEYSIH